MSDDLEKDIIHNYSNKSELERTLTAGISGPPEIKKEEKLHFLGVFKERVLKVLTKKQVKDTMVHSEIITALKDKRATNLLISGDISFKARQKYQQQARELGIKYTVIFDPLLKGDIGLIVASDNAVDVEDISVEI